LESILLPDGETTGLKKRRLVLFLFFTFCDAVQRHFCAIS